jgi:hypothetical protein
MTSTAKSDLLELVTAFENKSIEGVDNILSFSKCAVTQKALAYEEMRTRNEIALGVASMLSTLGVGTMASLASAGAKVAAGAVNTSKISKLLGVTQLAVEALAAGEGLVQFSMSRDRCKRMEEEALIGGPAGRLHFEECRHEMETRGLFALLPLIRPALAAAKFAKGAAAGSNVVKVAESIDAPPVVPGASAPASVPAPVKLAPLELPPPPARMNAPVDTAKLAPLELPPPPVANTAANTVDGIPVVTGRIIHPDVEDFAKLLPNDGANFLARYADEFDAMAPALKKQFKEALEMITPPSKRASRIKDFFNLPKGIRAQNITRFISDNSFNDLKAIVQLRKMVDEGASMDAMIAFVKSSLSGKAQTRALEVLQSGGKIGGLIPEFTQNSLVAMKNYLDAVGVASEIVPVGAKGPAHIKILGDKSTTRSYLTRYAKALKSSRDHDVVWEPMSEATGAKHGLFEADKQKLVVPKEALDVGGDRFSADSILGHEGLHSQTAKFIKEKQNRPFLGNMSGDGLPPGPSVYQEGQHFDEIRTFTFEGKHHLKRAKRFAQSPNTAENNIMLDKETYSVLERSVAAKMLSERTLETVEMVKQASNKTITFVDLNAQNYPLLVDGTQVVAAQVTLIKNGKTVSMTIPLVNSAGSADVAGNMALLNSQLDDLAKFSRESIKGASELIEEANALRVSGGIAQHDPNLIKQAFIQGG